MSLRREDREEKYAKELEELIGTGVQANTPVGQNRKQKGTEEKVRDCDDGVGEDICSWPVETVHALTRENETFFEEGRDTGNTHEAKESD